MERLPRVGAAEPGRPERGAEYSQDDAELRAFRAGRVRVATG